jgi:hypothetical protein
VRGPAGLSLGTPVLLSLSKGQWKAEVKVAIEEKNKKILRKQCFKSENGVPKIKTKTAIIVDKLDSWDYVRRPVCEILKFDKKELEWWCWLDLVC